MNVPEEISEMTIEIEWRFVIRSISDGRLELVQRSFQVDFSCDSTDELRQQQSTHKSSTRYMENKLFSEDFVDNIRMMMSIRLPRRLNSDEREKAEGKSRWRGMVTKNHSHIKITTRAA